MPQIQRWDANGSSQKGGSSPCKGVGWTLRDFSSWHCSHQEFPNVLMFKPSSAAAAAPAPSCWHVQEEAFSSSDILYQSPHGLHVPQGTALGSGAAIRDLFRRRGWKFFWGRKIFHPFIFTAKSFTNQLLALPTKSFPFMMYLRIYSPIWEEQELLQCSGGRLMLLQHLAGWAALLLPEKKIGTELLRDTKPQFPALVQNWTFLIKFLSFKFTNPGTHGM